MGGISGVTVAEHALADAAVMACHSRPGVENGVQPLLAGGEGTPVAANVFRRRRDVQCCRPEESNMRKCMLLLSGGQAWYYKPVSEISCHGVNVVSEYLPQMMPVFGVGLSQT